MTIREKLGKELIFFDGGTGTILQEQGLKAGELPEIWNIEHREAIVSLHKNYLLAGADILKTNTFGANRLKFPGGEGYDLTEIVTADPAAAQYLQCQMRFSIMMKDVYEIIGEATGLGDMLG